MTLSLLRASAAAALLAGCSGGSTGSPATFGPNDAGHPTDGGHSKGADTGGFDASGSHDASDAADVYILPPNWHGGSPDRVAASAASVSLALGGSDFYWQGPGGTVYGCPLAGCPNLKPVTLSPLTGGGAELQSLAVAGSTVVFVSASGASLTTFPVSDPTKATTLYTTTTGTIGAFVTDATNVYFFGSPSGNGASFAILACALTGSTPCKPRELYTSSSFLGTLAISGSDLFVSEQGTTTTIRAVPTQGGAARTVCAATEYSVQSLAAAGGYVYGTLSGDPTIYTCLASGSGTTPWTAYVRDYEPYGLASDGTNLYWTNYVPTTGTVAVCALGATCTKPETVASMQDSPYAIAVGSAGVYWTTSSFLYEATK